MENQKYLCRLSIGFALSLPHFNKMIQKLLHFRQKHALHSVAAIDRTIHSIME